MCLQHVLAEKNTFPTRGHMPGYPSHFQGQIIEFQGQGVKFKDFQALENKFMIFQGFSRIQGLVRTLRIEKGEKKSISARISQSPLPINILHVAAQIYHPCFMAYISMETHTKLMSFHYLNAGDLTFLKTYHKPIF